MQWYSPIVEIKNENDGGDIMRLVARVERACVGYLGSVARC
jgi:hypothetical protein